MNSQIFFERLFLFLRESKITFRSSLMLFFSSWILVLFYLLLIAVFRNMRRECKKKSGKTRIQLGCEAFLEDFFQPVWNGDLDLSSAKVRKYLLLCEQLRQVLPEGLITNEEGKPRPILLHMGRKYWAPCFHVLLEKVTGETIPDIIKSENPIERVRKLHDAMSQLYFCDKNTGKKIELTFKSSYGRKTFKLIVMDVYFIGVYFLIHLMLSGLNALALYVDCLFMFILLVFRRKLKPLLEEIDYTLLDIILGIIYLFLMMCGLVLLQNAGLIPYL